MSKSNIDWTQDTWNPIVGCSILSPGCKNCYAMGEAARQIRCTAGLGRETHYAGTVEIVKGKAVWTGKLALAPEHILLQPLKRKKPTTYFVNSMGDLFHEDVPFEWIRAVFGVMARCPQHTFQILTKRAKRMRKVVQRMIDHPMEGTIIAPGNVPDMPVSLSPVSIGGVHVFGPLSNVWLGVSTERQQEADERIPELLQTPAAVRFISVEPLLGPINLRALKIEGVISPFDALKHGSTYSVKPDGKRFYHISGQPTLDWVIVGGESGPGSRPMHPDWARSLRDQCSAAGVPFFFKQWGNWRPEIDRDRDDPEWRQPYADYREPHFQMLNLAGGRGFHGERLHVMRFCSKKSTGRLLDGITHDAMPTTKTPAERAIA
jgi:protein gp37